LKRKVRDVVTAHGEGKNITLQGITLSGRQLRDQLIAKRNAKRLTARLKVPGLLRLRLDRRFLNHNDQSGN
jgi:hypothetical protein